MTLVKKYLSDVVTETITTGRPDLIKTSSIKTTATPTAPGNEKEKKLSL